MTRSACMALAAMIAAAPLPLSAQGPVIGDGIPIRVEDVARLDALDQSAGAALRQVLATGSAQDIAQATGALTGAPLPADRVDPASLAGDWACSMTKLGGNLAVVTYPAFKCRITAQGGAIIVEKLTGSQRTRGQVHRDGDRLVYLGSTFVHGEQPRDYGDFPQDVNLEGTETLPDVGIVEQTGRNSLRILFPEPYRESFLNVLTLSR